MNSINPIIIDRCTKGSSGGDADEENDFYILIIWVAMIVLSLFIGLHAIDANPTATELTIIDVLPFVHGRAGGYADDGQIICTDGKDEISLYVYHISRYKVGQKDTWMITLSDRNEVVAIFALMITTLILSSLFTCFLVGFINLIQKIIKGITK